MCFRDISVFTCLLRFIYPLAFVFVERETEGEEERERETDRQTDRHTDTQTKRERERVCVCVCVCVFVCDRERGKAICHASVMRGKNYTLNFQPNFFMPHIILGTVEWNFLYC